VARISGFVTDPAVTELVFAELRELAASRNVPLVVSAYRYCHEGMAGVETIAAELSAEAPDAKHVFVPVGGGGLFTAVARGYERIGRVPRLHAVQPAGCSTIAASFLRGDREIRPVTSTTRVSGLAVPFDIDASLALERLYASGGRALELSDEAIFAAQAMLMEKDGIYCEPAGAAALAGWLRAVEAGQVDREDPAVCLVTGHGSKDTASAESLARKHPAIEIPAGGIGAALEELL
jgi:threonine synthase